MEVVPDHLGDRGNGKERIDQRRPGVRACVACRKGHRSACDLDQLAKHIDAVVAAVADKAGHVRPRLGGWLDDSGCDGRHAAWRADTRTSTMCS